MDIHGVLPDCILQLALYNDVLLIDCYNINIEALQIALNPFFKCIAVVKIVYDVHRLAKALSVIAPEGVASLIDIQLLMEIETTSYDISFKKMLQHIDLEVHPHPRYLKQPKLVTQRPLREDAMEAAAANVKLLLQAYQEAELDSTFFKASELRLENAIYLGGARTLCFDESNGYRLASYEVLDTWQPESLGKSIPFHIHEDLSEILALLPEDLVLQLSDTSTASGLLDIVLDRGRRPWAWAHGARILLGDDDRITSQEDLDGIIEKVGGFGTDNRAGLERQLHRISAIRNRTGGIMGLTIRVGRYIEGNASLIADILADQDKNILFLGEPGCGKTTIVREVARQLANSHNVCIVDTSNEIAGDGDIPHPCVGLSRRLMVPSLDQQARVMVECVQNHTPEIMVIDEIGRPNEVEAARTCKQRGVRMIASAH
ncbi:hypothetical protein THRCLA_03412, partial [Thraustotheca clavata]